MSTESPRESLHEWDAAYVLGALSPADRRRYEEHLEGCAECRASVTELAGVPALLARVPAPPLAVPLSGDEATGERVPGPAWAASPLPSPTLAPPRDLLPTLARRVRRTRLRRRWALAGTSLLAAAAIAAAVVVPMRLDTPPAPTTSVALSEHGSEALSATVGLSSQDWGTSISMTCEYHDVPAGYANAVGHFGLYVTDASGAATRVASWSAAPGSTVRASGAVDLPVSQLRRVEVRDVDSGAVLLSSPVHSSPKG